MGDFPLSGDRQNIPETGDSAYNPVSRDKTQKPLILFHLSIRELINVMFSRFGETEVFFRKDNIIIINMTKIYIRINSRQMNILYVILQSNGHMTMKEIAEKTGYSVRVIRYNMPTVISWLKNEGVITEARQGHGFEFDFNRMTAKKLTDMLDADSEHVLSLTRGQRLRIELLELLIAERNISFQFLAENDGMSRSTVVLDMAQIESNLAQFNLKLVKSPNRGTYVEGSELFRRCAIINIIRNELGLVKYYGVWMDRQYALGGDQSIPAQLNDFIGTLNIRQCFQYIDLIEKGMGMRLALFSRVDIIFYLAILMKYLQDRMQGKPENSHFHHSEFDVEPGLETEIAGALISRVCRDLGIEAVEWEKNNLAVMLLLSKWNDEDLILINDDEYTGEHSYNISQDALTCADMITAACANQIHPLLQMDEELIMNLARHFHTIFNQINFGYPIFNENLPLIIREYPEIFRSVNSEISIIEDQIRHKIPPEEIGYIVMYMVSAMNKIQTEKRFRIPVLLISDGVRTKNIFLKDRLQLFFPTLEVTAVSNGIPEDDSIFDRIQLVLSLIPGVTTPKPVIDVSAFLTQNEIRTVQNWIIDYEERSRSQLMNPRRMPDLIDLLHPENIILNAKASSWEDVIRQASRPLEEQRLITPSFCNAIIRITEEYGPYTMLAPGVALLNARPNDGVNRLCMSMLILDRPVDFGVSSNVSIAFVLGASDNHSHLNALFQLSKICEQDAFIANLKKCTRSSEVLRAIWLYSSDISLTELM